MPSVRDLLAGATRAAASAAQENAVSGPEPKAAGVEPPKAGDSEMSNRIRQAALRRVELAKLEVEKLQDEIVHQEGRISDAQAQSLPAAEIKADMDEAQMRLREARHDLTRAEEALHNTEVAARQKVKPEGVSAGDAKQGSVRAQLKGLFNHAPAASENKLSEDHSLPVRKFK